MDGIGLVAWPTYGNVAFPGVSWLLDMIPLYY